MGLHDRLKTSNGSSSATAELLTRAEQLAASPRPGAFEKYASQDERIEGLSAARGLLKFLIN